MKRYLAGLYSLVVAVLCAVGACGLSMCGSRGADADNFNEHMQEASMALADGDYDHAQMLCDGLLAVAVSADSASVDASDVAGLGIMYMKLAEHRGEEDNVANATECLRRAMSLSADSLKAFSASLQLDDERHFVLLRRIGMSLGNPVEMYDGENAPDFFATDSIN